MASSLFSSKLRQPRPREGLLARPGLLARLGELLARPLVLVSAPPGFGKTSLAAQYVASLGPASRVAWLSLDAEDDDPIRFWRGIATTLSQALRDQAGPSPFEAVLEACSSPQAPPAQDLALALAQGIDALGAPCLLVLDDFHLLSSKAVLESFSRFLEAFPAGLTALLLSRVDPRLPLARLRARGLLGELRVGDLRFSPEEAERILATQAGLALSPSQARAIDAKTEGWGAGLQLAALSLGRRTDPEAFIRGFSGSDRLVLEFLTEEVLGVQAPELRDFLLSSALLDRFCAGLCEALFPPPGGSEEMLRRLESANLFLVPLDDEGGWYRYHHLFGEALRARLRVLDPGREIPVLSGAAAWEESQGDPEEAFLLYQRAGLKAEAGRVLEGIDYVARGELSTLMAHLDALGEELVLSRPHLADGYAWARVFSGRVGEALAWMPKALAAGEAYGAVEKAYLQGSFASLRAFVAMMGGRVGEAVAEARQARSLLGPQDWYPLSIIPFVLGSALRMEGRLEAAQAEFEGLFPIAQALASPWTLAVAHYETATTSLLRGRLGETWALLEAGLPLAKARGFLQLAWAARLGSLRAEVLYEADRLDEAEREAGALVATALEAGLMVTLVEITGIWARILLARGRLDEAGTALARAEAVIARGDVLPRMAAPVRELGFRLSLLGPARAANPEAPALPPGWSGDFAAASAIRLCEIGQSLAQGRWPEAREGARALATLAASGGWGRLLVASQGLEALALQAGGREGEALAALAPALELGLALGLKRTLVDLGGGLGPLLKAVIASGAEPGTRAYAVALLSALEASVAPATAVAPATPARRTLVSAREREVLLLLAEGHSNKEIAEGLFISESTVKSHLYHLSARLEAPNRVALLAKARALGLL